MTREVQGVLLILVGTAVMRVSVGDIYLRYVKEVMQPFLIAAALALLVLGIMSVWQATVQRRSPASGGFHKDERVDYAGADVAGLVPAGSDGVERVRSGADTDSATGGGEPGGHDHAHGPRIAVLLLLPVLAILFVAPPALGSYSASRESNNVAAPVNSVLVPLPAGDVVDLTIADYCTRAIWDEGRSLEGRTVRLSGFVTPGADGGWYLARLSLACCAADAQVAKVEVTQASAPETDTWVEVTGTWAAGGGVGDESAVPLIVADTVVSIQQPSNPYIG